MNTLYQVNIHHSFLHYHSVNPILHTAWLDNHAQSSESNTEKYYFDKKSKFLHTFVKFADGSLTNEYSSSNFPFFVFNNKLTFKIMWYQKLLYLETLLPILPDFFCNTKNISKLRHHPEYSFLLISQVK
jgi:hypothetical protein